MQNQTNLPSACPGLHRKGLEGLEEDARTPAAWAGVVHACGSMYRLMGQFWPRCERGRLCCPGCGKLRMGFLKPMPIHLKDFFDDYVFMFKSDMTCPHLGSELPSWPILPKQHKTVTVSDSQGEIRDHKTVEDYDSQGRRPSFFEDLRKCMDISNGFTLNTKASSQTKTGKQFQPQETAHLQGLSIEDYYRLEMNHLSANLVRSFSGNSCLIQIYFFQNLCSTSSLCYWPKKQTAIVTLKFWKQDWIMIDGRGLGSNPPWTGSQSLWACDHGGVPIFAFKMATHLWVIGLNKP